MTKETVGNQEMVYIGNYMVGGFLHEHKKFGGKGRVALGMGIEHVRQGVVLVDRYPPREYLQYLEDLGLFDPDLTQLIEVSGQSRTLVGRVLEQGSGIVSDVREGIDRIDSGFIDTFGISEVTHESSEDPAHEYRRLEESLGMRLFYNPEVALELMSKSNLREQVDTLREADPQLRELLQSVPGINHLSFEVICLGDVQAFIQEHDCESIVLKRDIESFNRGNITFEASAIMSLKEDERFVQFLRQKCPFITDEDRFCIEKYIPFHTTPSVYLENTFDGEIVIRSMQEQKYENNTLLGFKYPLEDRGVEEKLTEICFLLGAFLREKGYVGHSVPDFLVTEEGDIYLMEINMRKGGSSVPQHTVSRLHGGSTEGTNYISSLVRARPGVDFSQLVDELDGERYDPKHGDGIVVVEAGRFHEAGLVTLVSVGREQGRIASAVEGLLAGKTSLKEVLR